MIAGVSLNDFADFTTTDEAFEAFFIALEVNKELLRTTNAMINSKTLTSFLERFESPVLLNVGSWNGNLEDNLMRYHKEKFRDGYIIGIDKTVYPDDDLYELIDSDRKLDALNLDPKIIQEDNLAMGIKSGEIAVHKHKKHDNVLLVANIEKFGKPR